MSKLNAIAKAKNLFVRETHFLFCAIDLWMSFLALAIASKIISKTVSETCAEWLQFGAVGETQGFASNWALTKFMFNICLCDLLLE